MPPSSWITDLSRLLLLAGLAIVFGTLWVALDRNVPAWDQAEHLSLAMNHWWLMHHSPWLSWEGLRQIWMITPKYPPVFYWVTAAAHSLLGPGPDQALLANGFFALLLLSATYLLGRHLFTPWVGMLAAGITLLLPRLIHIGLDYQLDYGVTALVTLAFACLTVWRDAKGTRQWLWMLAFGLTFGLALMTKQSALLFLITPIALVSLGALIGRHWERLLQLLLGGLTTLAVMVPWLSVNWIFQFSILGNTNVKSAQDEGDPLLHTLDAWVYYWRDLPAAVSWPLLIVPLVGIALWGVGLLPGRKSSLQLDGTGFGRFWLFTFWAGAYLLWSAIANKDPRYIAPYLPALAVFLAWGLACWWRKWPWVTYATLGLAIATTLFNTFPLDWEMGHAWARSLAPQAEHHPYQGMPFPHRELVSHIAQTQPYQIATVGGLQSTAAVNQHNISYFGKLQDYQVYGRQVGSRPAFHDLDLRSLSWFYAQGAPQSPWPPVGTDAQSVMAQKLHASPDFAVERTWPLPDGSTLYLYRRKEFPVTVTALPAGACAADALPRLTRVEVPNRAPNSLPLPITYEWEGSWRSLQSGLALITWELTDNASEATAPVWIHDHSIGLGTLRPQPIQATLTTLGPADINPDACFRVTERMAARPPAQARGTYRVTAQYLKLQPTVAADLPPPKEAPKLQVPSVSVTIAPDAPPAIAPELDWVSQLREAAAFLPQGTEALDQVFDPMGQINRYDPVQSYTVQAEASLQYRWQQEPSRLDFGYGVVLAQVLQMKGTAAIASLEKLVQYDAQNPYAHAYLAFVNLYSFRPKAAQAALQPALALAPDSPEINGLSAIAALLQGNLWRAWQQGTRALSLMPPPPADAQPAPAP